MNTSGEGEYTSQVVYEYAYDNAGNCITKAMHDGDGSLVLTTSNEYDSNNNLIKKTETDAEGTVNLLEQYEYDSRGNLLKISYDYYTIDSSSLHEYEYDEEDREVKHTYYSDGALETISCWEYDDYGKLVKRMEYSTDEASSYIMEYTYMKLQDYLSAKESIDQEEPEVANTQPFKDLLSIPDASEVETESAID